MTLERHTELKRGKPIARTEWKRKPPKTRPRRKASPNNFPEETKAAIRRRSGNVCELRLEGCSGHATQFHHRQGRIFGDQRPCNGLHLCANCHTASPAAVHRNVGKSRLMGWIVDAAADAAKVPVRWPDSRRGGR